jgi:acetylglutamate kinase
VALAAERLLMLTDVPGLYERWPDPDSLLSRLTTDQLDTLLPTLSAGMIPKMRACLAAVRCGVPRAHVLDGRTGAWIDAATGVADAGTMIVAPSESMAVLG